MEPSKPSGLPMQVHTCAFSLQPSPFIMVTSLRSLHFKFS